MSSPPVQLARPGRSDSTVSTTSSNGSWLELTCNRKNSTSSNGSTAATSFLELATATPGAPAPRAPTGGLHFGGVRMNQNEEERRLFLLRARDH